MDIIKKSLHLWMPSPKKKEKKKKREAGEIKAGQAQLMTGKKDVIVQCEVQRSVIIRESNQR